MQDFDRNFGHVLNYEFAKHLLCSFWQLIDHFSNLDTEDAIALRNT